MAGAASSGGAGHGQTNKEGFSKVHDRQSRRACVRPGLVLAALLAAMLAGCGGGEPEEKPAADTAAPATPAAPAPTTPAPAAPAQAGNPRVPPAGSDDFQAAYMRGCDSGMSDAGQAAYQGKYSRDPAAFASNPEYRKGWVAGYRACFKWGDTHRRLTLPGGS